MVRVSTLVKLYNAPLPIRKIAELLVTRKGAEIPSRVKIGSKVSFPHNSIGTVIHPSTTLESGCRIYQNVTIGRGDIWKPYDPSSNLSFRVGEGAILCAGCKVICSKGELVVGKNTIVAANAVLLESTGENEVWGGVPARKLKDRDD